MARKKEIVDAEAIAEVLGVSKRTAWRYITRDDFPEPVLRLGRTRGWDRKAVERWGRTHLPLPEGRPWPKRGGAGR
jgi:predicted DNA-binding transcriptional regulator AlpA